MNLIEEEEKGHRFKDKCPAMAFNSLSLSLSLFLSLAGALFSARLLNILWLFVK